MKLLVVISICACISQIAAVSTDIKSKMPAKLANAIPANAIPASQKPELFYSHQSQPSQTEFMPVPVMQKQVLVAPHQQPTMLIIAQPAYVPQNVLYGGQPSMQQQLLNYFHTNPQAKYQFLYGGYQPQPTAQPFLAHSPLGASTVAAYQYVPSPVFGGGYNHLVAAPSQLSYSQPAAYHPNHIGGQQYVQAVQAVQPVQHMQHVQHVQSVQPMQHVQSVQPMQLNQISHLAQLAAQQFHASPLKGIAPIITGLENFTPEQQAQIKAQLNLGAPLATPSTVPSSTSQYSGQMTTQPSHGISSSDYMHGQDKTAQPTSTSFAPSLMYRAQYTKG